MKKILSILTVLLFNVVAFSQSNATFKNVMITNDVVIKEQAAIGANVTNDAAALDIESTFRGLLIPRMTTVQRDAIAAPLNGLMVYDNSVDKFSYYDGFAWVYISSGTAGATTFLELLDTPVNYTGKASDFLRVNVGENGVSFVDGSTINVSEFINDAGYLTTVTIPSTYLETGDNVTELVNDAGYLTSVTPVTHTGEVTGATALTISPTAISNKMTVTGASGDFLLLTDGSDAGNLKKVDANDFLSGGGDGNGIYSGSGSLTGITAITDNGFDLYTLGVGNFGVGVVPTQKLHIGGDTKLDGNMGINIAPAASGLRISPQANSNNSLQLLDAAGVVSIFSIDGNGKADLDTDVTSHFGLGTPKGNGSTVRIGVDGSNNALQVVSSGLAVIFEIEDNGNTGIAGIPILGKALSVSGNTQIDGSLEVNTTTGALIIPRLTTTERDALTPLSGMMLFNITADRFQGYRGGSWRNLD